MSQLTKAEEVIEDLQITIENKKKDEEEERARNASKQLDIVERGVSPIKFEEPSPIYLKGVTRKIYKMDLSFSERKRKSFLQQKLQQARDRAKEIRSSLDSNSSRCFGTNLTSILENCPSSVIDKYNFNQSCISDSEIFSKNRRAETDEMDINQEYPDSSSLYPSFSVREISNTAYTFQPNEQLSYSKQHTERHGKIIEEYNFKINQNISNFSSSHLKTSDANSEESSSKIIYEGLLE